MEKLTEVIHSNATVINIMGKILRFINEAWFFPVIHWVIHWTAKLSTIKWINILSLEKLSVQFSNSKLYTILPKMWRFPDFSSNVTYRFAWWQCCSLMGTSCFSSLELVILKGRVDSGIMIGIYLLLSIVSAYEWLAFNY